MHSALGLVIAVLCILGGTIMLIFPQTVSHLQEDADTTPTQARRELRVGGAFLVLFGWALLYSILTWDGQPVEFIGV
jgi:uncharacterized protein YjeT (DUF2065 family)